MKSPVNYPDPARLAGLVSRLRALSAYEHDDLSIGAEAADELEALAVAVEQCRRRIADLEFGIRKHRDSFPDEPLEEELALWSLLE